VRKKCASAKTIGFAYRSLLAFAVHDLSTTSTNIAAILLGACFALAFLLLIVGAIVKQLRGAQACGVIKYAEDDGVLPPPLPNFGKVGTWWCHTIDAAGLFLISGLFVLFAFSQLLASEQDLGKTMNPSLLLGNIVVFAILVAGVTAIVYWRVKPVTWLGLRWKQWPLFFFIGPAAVIVMWVVLGVLQTCGYIAWLERLVGSPSTQDAVKLLRESKDLTSVFLMAFSAAIVAPIAEEVIFRGYLYPVAKSFAGPWIGMLFSALVFAAGHGNVPLLLPLFLLGLLLALAYEVTGSLWAAISIHFFFNSATVGIQLAMRAGYFSLPETMP
jgi:membrane protease YdiL (CAAX protease family)